MHRGFASDGSRHPNVDVLIDLLAVDVPCSQPHLQVTDCREFRLTTALSFAIQQLLLSHFIINVQFVNLLHDLLHQEN